MLTAAMTILYVANPLKSARFYADLFQVEPVEAHPTFCQLSLPGGFQLGLWSKYTAEPMTRGNDGNFGELFITAGSKEEVDITFSAWAEKLLDVVQKPVDLDFGYTFAVVDADGHRIRVCFLN